MTNDLWAVAPGDGERRTEATTVSHHSRPATPPQSRAYGIVEFRAMASPCRIVADDLALARAGERLVHDLEARWSRFRPDSEVSRVNRAAGSVCVVSPWTRLLFERAELARHLTGGLFNPLVLERVELVERLGRSGWSGLERSPVRLTEERIVVMASASAVALPDGRQFDPGGIGKGLAADLVAEHLLGLGATTAQIELGGDVRLVGEEWTGGPWHVDVIDPRDRSRCLARMSIAQGAVATSSSLGRRWEQQDDVLHHLIDPATGWPSRSDLVSVTASSSELWWAEVAAKSVLLAGSARAAQVMHELGVSGLSLDQHGVVTPYHVELKEGS